MVAADNHRHRSEIKDFSHRRLQIAESLVASAGTHVHIAAVDDDLPLVEEHLVEHRIVKAPQPIGIDGGGIAHRPRRHASPRARTRSQIVGKPENGHVGIARTQVVQTRAQPRLHEGGDARKGQIEEVAGVGGEGSTGIPLVKGHGALAFRPSTSPEGRVAPDGARAAHPPIIAGGARA